MVRQLVKCCSLGVCTLLARKIIAKSKLVCVTLALLGCSLEVRHPWSTEKCATTPHNAQIRTKIRTHLYLLYLLYQHNLQGPPCCSIPMETRKKDGKILLTNFVRREKKMAKILQAVKKMTKFTKFLVFLVFRLICCLGV